MKKLIVKIMVLTSFLSFFGCNNSTDPSAWSSNKTDEWFEKGEWLNGWAVTPDASINRQEFAVSYFRNKERWDRAFEFLKNSKLSTLELMRYDIDGDKLFATPSEYLTRNREDVNFEAHRQYIDIQYVISGKELIGITPVSLKEQVVESYDSARDIEFMTVTRDTELSATPDRFFIFFPSDAHRPGLKDGDNSQVRKIVVKVKVD